MMPWSADSRVIRASAGYGKTETLCLRLLAMMLNDPGMIRKVVALTFTRAAAAEIYDRLLSLICDALNRQDGVSELREKIGGSVDREASAALMEERLLKLLRDLVDAMGELNISTIDSFFYRLVGAYSIELGLPGRVELAPEGDKATADALLREALHASGCGERNFLDACRESRHGEEKKSFFASCVDLLSEIGRYGRFCADRNFWGGKFSGVEIAPGGKLRAAFANCEKYDWGKRNKDYRKKLSPVLAECANADHADHHFSADALAVLRKFFPVLDGLPDQRPDGFKQNWDFTGVVDDLRMLIGNAGKVLLAQCARRSRGLGELLKAYRAIYDREMLRKGRINFSDLPRLLSEEPLDLCALNEIQYRTNSRFKHFLIDEFQDTSRLQWSALEPCIGDNGEGDHSLFIVGDVKQAIYGWREGDSKLMGEVAADGTRALKLEELPCSYRYGQNICDVLNRLFGAENLRHFELLPEAVKKRWQGVFLPHRPAANTVPGEFSVLALAPLPKERKETFADLAAVLILKWLRENDFFGGGYSVGVLVRDNRDGIDLRDALVGLDPDHADRFVWEADENIASDPLVASLIAFGICVQFPGETLAAETVRMNPLLRELLPENEAGRRQWLDVLGEAGVNGFLQAVLKKIRDRADAWSDGERIEPPSGGNVDTLLGVAREFDAVSGVCDMRRFRDCAVLAKKPAAPAEGKLRILTVHHSKGLTFNVVFYLMFDTRNRGNWRNPDPKGVVSNGEWLLYSPREEGMRIPDIAAAVKRRDEDSRFEELCALYVALTRANRGMHVLLPPRTKEKLEAFHPDWNPACKGRGSFSEQACSYYISDMVFESFFAFDPRFGTDVKLPVEHVSIEVGGGAGAPVGYPEDGVAFIRSGVGSFEAPVKKVRPRVDPMRIDRDDMPEKTPRRLRRATPSHLADGAAAKLYFALPDPESGAELGTRLHEFFAKIDRWSDFTPPANTDPVLLRHFGACAGNRDVVELFDETDCEVWKERLFDVILPDGEGGRAIVTGCFDRVQIRRRADGGVESACIIDFKSNNTTEKELPKLCDHYRRQLETYRAALAKLLGITPNLIECRLLFTKLGALETI